MFSSTHNNSRHRRFIAVSGVLIVALSLCIGAAEIWLGRRGAIDAAYQRLEDLARIADENISGRLIAIDLMLQDIGRDYQAIEKSEDEAALLAFMKARSAALEGVRSISITDPNGVVVETTLPSIKGYEGGERPYFSIPYAAVDKNRLFLNGPIVASTGAVVVFASRPLPLVNGAWSGVALSSLSPELFTGMMESVRPDNGFAAVVGAGGTIMARAPDQEKFAGVNIANGPAFSAHMASGRQASRTIAVTATENREMLVASRTARFSELIINVGLPLDDALASWRMKAWAICGVLLLSITLSLLVLRLFRRHEKELLEQRNFARQVVETANVMVVGTDRYGDIRLFNAAAEVLTGYERAAVKGKPWPDMLNPADCPEKLRQGFQRGEPQSGEMVAAIRTQNGEERVVAWRHNAVSGNADIKFIAFGLDLSERLQTERRLEASQRFLRAIADNMPGMIGYWDADLRCRFANKAYLEWFGKTPEKLIGETMKGMLGEKLFAMNEQYIRGALRGNPQNFERTLVKPDGSVGYTWAHYIPDVGKDGSVLGFFVLVSDITPLKKVELQLREVSERLAVATKAGGIGVWVWDVVTQRLLWDQRMYDLYGVDPAQGDLTYDVWRRACQPDDLARVETELQAAMEGRAPLNAEFRILGADGGFRHIKAAASVDFDGDGRPLRMIGVNWDVTALRESEAALKAAQERAEKASQAKSQFLANMSHEIRTPMNAILGLAHLLERADLNEDQQAMAVKIGVAGRSLLSIINDILDFSKIEAGRLELDNVVFRLSGMMDAMATIMTVNAAAKNLELVFGVAEGTPDALMGDNLRLQQVLINLLSNAVKFTEKGVVSLRVEACGRDQTGRVELRFTVKDSGIGIPATVIPKLFDSFTQADSSTTRRFGGSGLGLAICKRLVALMDGRMGVESAPGQGSIFWFVVPLAPVADNGDDLRDFHHADSGIAELLAADPPRVLEALIVDDLDIARESMAATAHMLGWRVETAASGAEALRKAYERVLRRAPYDVMIVDWRMPGMDGLATGRAARGLDGLKQAPIVILATAHDREALTQEPDAEALDAVLVKPVTASSLLNAVKEALVHRKRGGRSGVARSAVVGLRRLAGVRLLLVEDNGINQDVACRVLELEGALVTVAGDGRQAVDALAASPSAFDAVLMDIQMPVMDGYQAARYIRNELSMKSMPIIALTAGASEAERELALQAGMNDFIAKPFDVHKMVRRIAQYATVAPPAAAQVFTPAPARVASVGALSVAIPGIDMRQAALRLGDDAVLFASLLKRVWSEFADTASRVRSHLTANEPEIAARILHTLRGAVGNIAAKDVAMLASKTEAAIKDAKESATVDDLINQLDAGLSALRAAIVASGVLEETPGVVAPPPSKPAAPIGEEELTTLLQALSDHSMSALELFGRLRTPLCAAYDPAVIENAGRDIENLRFEAAAQKLKGLTTQS